MAFIDKNMVYSHRAEIHGIVFSLADFHAQLLQLGIEVLFSLFQPLLHLSAAVAHGGLFQHFKRTLHVVKFFRENVNHRLLRLRYLGELVVCQYDTVPVVVLDFGEYLLTVGRGKVLLARVKHFRRGVRLADRVGYLVHVGF